MKMQKKHKTVVVGMSGGVDSAVAAALLVKQGYNVIGITIKTYNYEDIGGNISNETSCCSLDGINDARRVAQQLGFPHYVVDLTVPFKEQVIDYFVDTYLHGETPNPCVMCNRHIKWAQMLHKADALGAEYIATGHYVRLGKNNISGRYMLSRATDAVKDQSYALWNVAQEHLARTLFPLAEMTKPEVRAAATRFGLDIANKHESYEICFIPDNDYTRFLRDNVSDLSERIGRGDIMYRGEKVGEHEGYPFYTIGQRRGLNVSIGKPAFVTSIEAGTNTIVLGDEEELLHKGLVATQINLIKYAALEKPLQITAKIRYKDPGEPAIATQIDKDTVKIEFDAPRRAITPGQSVVMYEGDDVIGGGVIKEWFA